MSDDLNLDASWQIETQAQWPQRRLRKGYVPRILFFCTSESPFDLLFILGPTER